MSPVMGSSAPAAIRSSIWSLAKANTSAAASMSVRMVSLAVDSLSTPTLMSKVWSG